jgi:retron-type reverse transcriptase
MISYKDLYQEIYSKDNLLSAFNKARKGKNRKDYVIKFKSNLNYEINNLQSEIQSKTYRPKNLKKFIIRDPKTRTIHASIFRDRVIHHAIINILEPIFERIFIYDSFASRDGKGTHKAVLRLKSFIRKASSNGSLIRKPFSSNSIRGYVLKADIRKYFDTMNHEVLINIIKRKIKDDNLIWLIRIILDNFETSEKGKGLPLGNFTSQFFANIYLNELDYFVKHELNAKYYIRYVDDFVILHKSKRVLEYYLIKIREFLPSLKIELHPDKTEIYALRNGITFLGYRIFYHYSLLRKRNIRYFMRRFNMNLELYKNGEITREQLMNKLNGWFGYAKWADTFSFRQKILSKIPEIYNNTPSQ